MRTLRALKEESKRRFRELTERFAPITKFYFHRVWVNYAAGESPQEFGQFLYQGTINESSSQTQVRLFLSKTLVQCTAGEAERLARDPVLLPHINDSVLIILVLLVENVNHYECLKSCLVNYLHVVQKHILPPLVTPEANPTDRATLVKFLNKLIAKLPASTRDRLLCAMTFGLSAIIQQLRTVDASLDLGDIEKVLNLDQLQSSSEAAMTSKLRHQHLNRSNSSSPSSSASSTTVDSVAASPPPVAEPEQQHNGIKEEEEEDAEVAEPTSSAMVTE